MPLAVSADKGRVRITGGIAIAASFAQTLLLEYAEGKPMADVGWGQVTPAMITDLSRLHALEYTLVARPPFIAKTGAAALLQAVSADLRDPQGPAFAVFVGHDTNLALIGGALDVHWQGRGFAADDPGPGAALVFELWREPDGSRTVRLRYRSQSLDAIRQLAPLAATDTQPVAFPACTAHGPCSLAAFSALVGAMARR
jgi:4-phytase/acid phosphatase